MRSRIENQIAKEALKLPNLSLAEARKLERILDLAYRALISKKFQQAHRILQLAGGRTDEAEIQSLLAEFETDCRELTSNRDTVMLFALKDKFANCLSKGKVIICGDDHCLFSAFGYSLNRTWRKSHEVALNWATQLKHKLMLRRQATEKICEDPFLKQIKTATLEDGPCPEDKDIKNIHSYCNKTKTTCWGDNTEIVALMTIYEKDVLLIQSRPNTTVDFLTHDKREVLDTIQINPRDVIYLIYTGRHYDTFNPDVFYKFSQKLAF